MASKRVLIIDDEPAITDAIESSLIDEHYTIYKAGCAAEALSVLEHHSITVIISDQSMPGMSGSELCSIVHERWPTTYRILLLSSEKNDQDEQVIADSAAASQNADIHQVLEKPWDAMLLRYNINEGIRQQPDLPYACGDHSTFRFGGDFRLARRSRLASRSKEGCARRSLVVHLSA